MVGNVYLHFDGYCDLGMGLRIEVKRYGNPGERVHVKRLKPVPDADLKKSTTQVKGLYLTMLARPRVSSPKLRAWRIEKSRRSLSRCAVVAPARYAVVVMINFSYVI